MPKTFYQVFLFLVLPISITYLAYILSKTKNQATMASPNPPTLADKNKALFDAYAHKYDSEDWTQAIVRTFTGEFRKIASSGWIGVEWADPNNPSSASAPPVRMLDFACGPGMVSFALLDRVTQARGLDLSPNMVSEYNKRARAAGVGEERMQAVAADLLANDPHSQTEIADEEWFGFDLAVISLALHHMEDPALVVRRLVERVRPGGVVVVLDWTDEPAMKNGEFVKGGPGTPAGGKYEGHQHHHGHGHRHGHSHQNGNGHSHVEETVMEVGGVAVEATIAHHGFTKADMEKMFREAGCDEVEYIEPEERFKFGGKMEGRSKQSFFARGRKAA